MQGELPPVFVDDLPGLAGVEGGLALPLRGGPRPEEGLPVADRAAAEDPQPPGKKIVTRLKHFERGGLLLRSPPADRVEAM